MEDIYDVIIEKKIEHDHWQSDLYVPRNKETIELLKKYPYPGNIETFTCQITKKLWYCIPFEYKPYYSKLRKR